MSCPSGLRLRQNFLALRLRPDLMFGAGRIRFNINPILRENIGTMVVPRPCNMLGGFPFGAVEGYFLRIRCILVALTPLAAAWGWVAEQPGQKRRARERRDWTLYSFLTTDA